MCGFVGGLGLEMSRLQRCRIRGNGRILSLEICSATMGDCIGPTTRDPFPTVWVAVGFAQRRIKCLWVLGEWRS